MHSCMMAHLFKQIKAAKSGFLLQKSTDTSMDVPLLGRLPGRYEIPLYTPISRM